MRRVAGNRRSEAGKDGSWGQQLVAVAIDGDKSSQHALKWAADHVISRGQIFVLLHVRRKITTIPTPTGSQLPISEVEEDVAATFMEQIDKQTKELILPFQCFCSRRGLQCKEVILEDNDVPKAIVGFVTANNVDKLVMGASSKNAFMRTLKSDVPTAVSKAAPDFCCVYIISKGKISSIRPASRPNKNTAVVHQLETPGNQFQSIKSEPDARHRTEAIRRSSGGLTAGSSPSMDFRPAGVLHDSGADGRSSTSSHGEAYVDHSYYSTASCPSPSRAYAELMANSHPLDNSLRPAVSLEKSPLHDHTRGFKWSREEEGDVWSFEGEQACREDLEAEMRRLKLELEHSRSIYSSIDDEEPEASAREEEQPRRSWPGAAQKKNISEERKMLQEMILNKKVLEGLSTDVPYRRYAIEEIQRATDNFSDELKIGEGGYGPVFRATLDDAAVAIKVLRPDAAQGAEQFQQEVEVLSCMRHANMVMLMGACPEYGCLVYEYMANGSLEDRLFRRSNTPPLPWQLRFKIAAEIASGLLFLHQTRPEPLVHRDLKPGNILLDHNFVGKIADVGLARLVPASVADAVTQYRLTVAAGTFCYIDPEYQQTGMLGIKSDIYALGIILLQLITAAPPMGLAHSVETALEEGRFPAMLDPSVPDWPVREARTVAELGLKCAELRKKDRPDLASVVLPQLAALAAMAQQSPLASTYPHPHSR
ncbi:U-box domain-containing protein 52-like [Wolffia australiana]